MQNLKFSVDINAPKEKVWKTLWEDSNYRKWTSVFSEGSHVVTDWNEGSKVLFLDGTGMGMYSVITRKIPNEFMSFKHIGSVKNGKEQPVDDESKTWSGAIENYNLEKIGDLTRLKVELDTIEDHRDIFKKTFPKALEKVKEMSEKSNAM